MAISVGIGSWADPEYTGILYPPKTAADERLKVYATVFDHVEVNSSYYATPRPEVVAGWAKSTPPGFIFHIKLHRAFSQSPRKTAEEGDLLERLLGSVQPLIREKKLGVFLLVLPPTFSPGRHSLDELDALAEKLAPHPLAVELRHSDWVKGDARATTLDFFRKRKLVWVAVDMPRIAHATLMPPVDEVTRPDLAYARLHGRNQQWLTVKSAAERHHYEYAARELTDLATRIRDLATRATKVYVVANNHAEDFAPKAAIALKERLGENK
jgi:uncharacterized protein YecE (DUF72 family)